MMICGLCDGPFELGQRIIKATASVVEWSEELQLLVFVPALLDDSSRENYVHEKCIFEQGIPPLLIRADHHWRSDV